MSYSDKLLNIVFDLSSIQAAITAASTEPNKTRCKSCNKKLGLTAFNCRCGDYYCSKHRHAEEHNCSYDYKAVAQKQLAVANILVQHDKLESRI
jgi:hypothetical protein